MLFADRCRRLLAVLVLSGLTASTARSAERIDLTGDTSNALQVRVMIDVEGELKTNADGKQVQRLPVNVAAEQTYVERRLNDDQDAAIRFYREAKADIHLGKAELKHSLRDERRHIALRRTAGRAALFSPLGPLSREELELVETPASLLAVNRMLPGRSVEVGETWKLTEATVADLLCLEVVHQQDIEWKLAKIEDGIATVTATGKASGAIEGVSSDVELIAKYNFDPKQKQITWLAMAMRENRAIGHAQPGFETVTKVRMVAGPASAPVELSEKSLTGLDLDGGSGSQLLELKSEKGGYELFHDRRWRVMVDRHDVAIMRLIDRGDLIAQCNVSQLKPLPNKEQLTLEGFQEDIRKTLGTNFGQIVEASQQVNEAGLRVLRVVASGNASELPIQWTYYHLSDDEGRRVSLVLTIEANLVERFAAVDRELISGFRFLDQPAGESDSQGPALGSAKANGAGRATTR